MSTVMADKRADLAGPGIGDYRELEKVLPGDYASLLDRKQTQQAIFAVKRYIEDNLCHELNLLMVTVPLLVDWRAGSTTCSTATARALPSPSTFPMTASSTRWTRRLCRRPPSGNAWPCASSAWAGAKACAPTCGPCARTTSSTMTTASTWISGIGSE